MPLDTLVAIGHPGGVRTTGRTGARRSRPVRLALALAALAVAVAVACSGPAVAPTPQPTPDIDALVRAAVERALPSPPAGPTPDTEATIAAGVRATVEALASQTPTPSSTPTATPSPTPTPLPTRVPAPSPSATATPTDTPTATHTPTSTPSPTGTPTPSPSPTATPTATPTSTLTPTPTPTPTFSPTPTATPELVLSISDIAEELRPSVVRIKGSQGIGTGFVVDPGGLIVTNAHVVGSDLVVEVTLSGGSVRSGLVLGRAPSEDIALLAIDGYQMPAVDLGTSRRPRIGEDVLAMGYAFDLPGTASLTRGSVSAFRPNAFGPLTALQTDTALNPGNSGGPLVDLTGQVVGINTAGIIEAQGINFAIAMDEAAGVVDRLRAGEEPPNARFASQTYPFSIRLPAGWRIYEIAPGYVYMRDEASSGEVVLRVQAVGSGVTTDRFADTQTRLGAAGEFDSYRRDSTERVTLAGLPAWEVVETWRGKGYDFLLSGAEYFLVSGGQGYSIYTQSERSEWPTARAVTGEIVSNFRLNNVEPGVSPSPIPTSTLMPTATATPVASPYISGWRRPGPSVRCAPLPQ